MITIQMLTNKEETAFGTTFRILDLDSDGIITRQELENRFAEVGRRDPADIDLIMSNCDFNQDYSITYTEFLTVSINWKQLLESSKLDMVMNYFGIIRKGALSYDELKAIFQGVSPQEWNKFFERADSNKDGLISVQELKSYFLEITA